jgi:hypothetical protein
MARKIPGILTCLAAIGLCILASGLESDLVTTLVTVGGAIGGVVGFVLIVFEWPKRRDTNPM